MSSKNSRHELEFTGGRWKNSCSLVLLGAVIAMIAPLARAQPVETGPLEPIRLQLKWEHQFQFAGYYAALEKGFYAQEGLDVTLLPLQPDQECVDAVVTGRAEYGVGDAGLLSALDKGVPIVILAQIFQNSPSVLVTLKNSGITEPHDLAGKRVMLEMGAYTDPGLRAMLKQTLGSLSEITVVPQVASIQSLLSGEVDASGAYLGNEPYLLKELGRSIYLINPRDYGIDICGDNLFTTAREVAAHPERVARITRATLQGWEYALSNTEELIDIIVDKYAPERTRDHLRYEARMTEMAVLPHITAIGSIEPGRYDRMAENLADLGLLEKGRLPENSIYLGWQDTSTLPTRPDLFTSEELAWIVANPEPRIGIFEIPPYQFVEDGRPVGYVIELMNALLGIAGIEPRYLTDTLEGTLLGLREGRYDITTAMIWTPERSDYINFSEAEIPVTTAIFGRPGATSLSEFSELEGKTMASYGGYAIGERLRSRLKSAPVVLADSADGMLRLVASGEADYCIQEIRSGEYALRKGHITNVEVKGILKLPDEPLIHAREYGVRADLPLLNSILSKANIELSQMERQRIWNRWFNASGSPSNASRLVLTEAERDWLFEHPDIRVGMPAGYPGVSFPDKDGNMKGLLVDYLALVGNITGIEFAIERATSSDLDHRLGAETIDLFPTSETADSLDIPSHTRPVFETSYAIVTRQEVPIVAGKTWLRGKRVAIQLDTGEHRLLQEKELNLDIVPVKDVAGGLQLVQDGACDAFVGGAVATSYTIMRNHPGNLKISAPTGFPHLSWRFAVREDWPELKSILDKAIASIPQEAHDALLNKWVSVRFEQPANWHRLLRWAGATVGVLVLMLVMVSVWLSQLRRKVAARTSELAFEKEQLRTSEERLAYTLEATNDGVWDWDIKNDCVYWSPRAFEMLGYTQDEFDITFAVWRSLIHPDDLYHAESVVLGAIDDGAPFVIELRYRRKDEGWQWVLSRGKITGRDADGQSRRMVGTHQDLTERKRYEEAIKQSAGTARALLNAPADTILLLDRDGIVLDANETAIRGIDRSGTGLVGHCMWDNFPPDLAHRRKAFVQQAFDTRRTVRFEDIRNDIHYATILYPIVDSDGQVDRIAIIARDITAQKHAEEERERLMSAIEQAAESIVISDTEDRIQYVNPAFERVSGYDRSEVIGLTADFLKSGTHDDSFYTMMRDTLAAGESWTGHITNKRKDGTLYTEEATISPVLSASGDIVNYVAVRRDISNELKLEMQLRQAQKMEAIGTLAGGIAHDFNNILNAILGYADLARDDLDNPELAKEDIEEILRAGNRAGDLVAQILTFSRKTEHETRPVRLGPIVEEAIKLLRASIPSTIEFDCSALHDTNAVMADSSQIHQIVMNLCTNSYHAMRETGGTITIGLRETHFSEEEAASHIDLQPGGYVQLAISDTGCGMSKEVLERIFEPYFTTKDLGEGTGLGMAVVHSIVKSHGGAIAVHSEPGVGTAFKLYFPLNDAPQVASEAAPETSRPRGTEHVLFVDDEEMNRALAVKGLTRLGYRVTTAANAIEALQLFDGDARRFDIMLTDLSMPKMSGIELARQVRQISQVLPIILCTGFHNADLVAKAREVNASELLLKPVGTEKLGWAIRKALAT